MLIIEADAWRPEIRPNQEATLAWWPKQDGARVVPTNARSEVYTSNRTRISTPATTINRVQDVERIEARVTVPAIGEYQWDIYWNDTEPGEQFHRIYFDAVRWPLNTSLGLNDLLTKGYNLRRDLEALGAQYDPQLSAAVMAQVYIQEGSGRYRR